MSEFDDVLKRYSEKIPKFEAKENMGWLPIHRAIVRNADLRTIQLLIQANPRSLRKRDSYGRNVVHLAVRNFLSPAILTALLDAMGDDALAEKTCFEQTPVEVGIQFKAPTEIFDCLLLRCEETQGGEHRALRLHIAMEHRCCEDTVRSLVTSNTRATRHVDSRGKSPLHIGIEAKAPYESIMSVLDAFLDAATLVDMRGYTPLHLCMIHYRNVNLIDSIYRANPRARDYEDFNGKTPTDLVLDHGTTKEKKEIIKRLGFERTRLGVILAYVDSQSKWKHCSEEDCDILEVYDIMLDIESEKPQFPLGWNPLHRAMCKRASLKETLVVLQHHPGAAQQCDNNLRFPLHVAMRNSVSREALSAVYEANPRAVHSPDFLHRTPLDLGDQFHAPVELFDCLLQAMTEIEDGRKTRLHIAMSKHCSRGTIDRLLNDNPPAALFQDPLGQTPLHIGIQEKASVDLLMRLIAVCPKATACTDTSGRSPLHLMACFCHNLNLAYLLMRESWNMCTSPDIDGKIPLHWAIEYNAPDEIINAFIEASPDSVQMEVGNMQNLTVLHLAFVHNASADVIRKIIGAYPGLVTTKKGKAQNIPLHLAMKYHASLPALKAVLSNEKESQMKSKNSDGMTPLHVAVSVGASRNLVETLLQCDSALRAAVDSAGNTALHLAIKNRAENNVIELLVHDAVEMKNLDRETALHVGAKVRAPVSSLRSVLSACPDACSMRDRRGNTPLFNILEQIYRVDLDANVAQAQSDASLETTHFIRELFDTDHETADMINFTGASPITVLLAKCMNSMDWNGLQASKAVDRLKILLSCSRDARPLKPLFNLRNQTALRAFFHILQDQDSDDHITVDLNKSLLASSQWTLLEILADFDTKHAAYVLLRILDHQQHHIGTKMVIGSGDEEVSFNFGDAAVSTTILTEVAKRSRMSNSSKDLRSWGQVYGRFLNRYRIDHDEDPLHVSETCLVVVGTELLRNGHEQRVALKFIQSEIVFRQEVERRSGLDSKYVIPVKAIFSSLPNCPFVADHIDEKKFGVDFKNQLQSYPKICLKSSDDGPAIGLQHLIVMEYGYGGDLHRLIDSQNIAAKDGPTALSIAKNIAFCLKYLNVTKGMIHGDVKARNFVARDGHDYVMIDLDSAASILKKEATNKTKTSTGCMSPETVAGRYDSESRLRASSKQDMWSFGVLLYQLCTGRPLFNVDTHENVDDEELLQLIEWTDTTKQKKLSIVKPGWPRALLSALLQKNPQHRPHDWNWVLERLHYTDEKFDRLVVLHSQPLVTYNKSRNMLEQLPLLDSKGERLCLNEALAESEIGARIEISYEPATWDRICEILRENRIRILHLSCHGHPDYVALEDGKGGMHKIMVADFKNEIAKVVQSGKAALTLVFLSACHSGPCAQALYDAGVNHVICCKQDFGLHDASATRFAGKLYGELALGKTIGEAFQIAIGTVAMTPQDGAKEEASKYLLLSRNCDSKIFFTAECDEWQRLDSLEARCNRIPREIDHFIGREIEMYHLISAIQQTFNVIRVRGESGTGKTSLVAAVCRYILMRKKDMMLHNVIWLDSEDVPSSCEGGPSADLNKLFKRRLSRVRQELLESSSPVGTPSEPTRGDDEDEDENDATLIQRSQRALEGRNALLVINIPQVDLPSDFVNTLVGDLHTLMSKKMILIDRRSGKAKKPTRWMEWAMKIKPLDYEHSVKLFGYHTIAKLVDLGCTLQEFVTTFGEVRDSDDQKELLKQLGGGIPSDIIAASTQMTQDLLQKLLDKARQATWNVVQSVMYS